MVDMRTQTRRETLEERLSRGAELLFDMEQRGDLGPEYSRWMAAWCELLGEYEELLAA
jgi:hypothetical protein